MVSAGNAVCSGERFAWSVTAVLAGAFACVLMAACASANPSTPKHGAPCDVPLEVNSTQSLLSSTAQGAEGILIFRGISYRLIISNVSDSEGYQGSGAVCGLDMPADIAGRYRVEGKGDVWRKGNGVEIHIHPPLPVLPKSGELEVRLAGSLLPRQP